MSSVKGIKTASNSGTLVFLLFVVFLVLKLAGVIDWSWWWVTSPLWLAAMATVAALILAGGVGFLIYRIVKRVRRKRRVETVIHGGKRGYWPAIAAWMASTVLGMAEVRSRQPVSVTRTSSSIRTPIPRSGR